MRALLDVNVLIALLDGGHAMLRRVTGWMQREAVAGRASRPITQSAEVRIMWQTGSSAPRPTAQLAQRRAMACNVPEHTFWLADVNLLAADSIAGLRPLAHRQVRDAYLPFDG